MSNWGKDMKKRFLAGILVCLLLTGCGPRRTEVLAQEPAAEGPTIAYVPLDDRPDNVERVVDPGRVPGLSAGDAGAGELSHGAGWPAQELRELAVRRSWVPVHLGLRAGDEGLRPLYPLYGSAALRRIGQFPQHFRGRGADPRRRDYLFLRAAGPSAGGPGRGWGQCSVAAGQRHAARAHCGV